MKKFICIVCVFMCILTGCSRFNDTVYFHDPESYTAVEGGQVKDTMASRAEFLKVYDLSVKFLPKDGGNAHYYLVYQRQESTGQADYGRLAYGRLSWYSSDNQKSFHIYLDEEQYVSTYSCTGTDAAPSLIRNHEVMLFRIPQQPSQLCQATLELEGCKVTVEFYNHTDEEIVSILRNMIKYN